MFFYFEKYFANVNHKAKLIILIARNKPQLFYFLTSHW